MLGYFGTVGILGLGILSCHPPKEMPIKLKNYYKNNQFFFASYNFLIFLDTQLHEPKISEKTISELLTAKIRKLLLVSGISVSNSNW